MIEQIISNIGTGTDAALLVAVVYYGHRANMATRALITKMDRRMVRIETVIEHMKAE